jgi:hypothetical protein
MPRWSSAGYPPVSTIRRISSALDGVSAQPSSTATMLHVTSVPAVSQSSCRAFTRTKSSPNGFSSRVTIRLVSPYIAQTTLRCTASPAAMSRARDRHTASASAATASPCVGASSSSVVSPAASADAPSSTA